MVSIVCANNRAKIPSLPKKSSIDFALASSFCTSSALGMASWSFRSLLFFSSVIFLSYF
jgi:hypothetical protein